MNVSIEIDREGCCGSEAAGITTTADDQHVDEQRLDPQNAEEIKDVVRSTYSKAAQSGTGCGCGCSTLDDPGVFMDESYGGQEGYVEDADLGLGCGIPTDVAGIEAGHRVLDLGSGAGIDAFIARELAGDGGHVTGVDFTPEMVELARVNKAKLGYENVDFLHGDIEQLPLGDDQIDVVVSNCVLNLVPDKEKAFREMARVLTPGGHFCISDVVTRGDLPENVRRSAELYAGCVAGAMDQDEYVSLLQQAGFENVTILKERDVRVPDLALESYDGAVVSITIRGDLPAVA
jgi:arsenite methyltransferase